MKIGYARVSTVDQNLDRQINQLEEVGCNKIFKEKVSGKSKDNREVFKECLEYVREQDTLVVSSLDRLGRNYDDITSVVSDLSQRNIKLMVLDMPFLNADIEDETMAKLFKDMIINLLSYVAETERKKMLERQAQGIAVAKEKGVYKGKPLEYSPNAKDKHKRAIYFNIVDDLKTDIPVLQISKKYDVTRKLIYRIRNDEIYNNVKEKISAYTLDKPFVLNDVTDFEEVNKGWLGVRLFKGVDSGDIPNVICLGQRKDGLYEYKKV